VLAKQRFRQNTFLLLPSSTVDRRISDGCKYIRDKASLSPIGFLAQARKGFVDRVFSKTRATSYGQGH
jgi:hypothetical protein